MKLQAGGGKLKFEASGKQNFDKLFPDQFSKIRIDLLTDPQLILAFPLGLNAWTPVQGTIYKAPPS